MEKEFKKCILYNLNKQNPSSAVLDLDKKIRSNASIDELYSTTNSVLLEHDRRTGVSYLLQKSRRIDREYTNKYNARFMDRKKIKRERELMKRIEEEESFMDIVKRAKEFCVNKNVYFNNSQNDSDKLSKISSNDSKKDNVNNVLFI